MKNLKDLVRSNIWELAPYSSARNEYAGHAAHIFLDANENPYNKPYNRYPDPLQLELKQEIAKIKRVKPEEIFLGNGSDEAIDLCFRVFCTPGKDNVVAIEPTYGMYKVCADINNVEYRPVLLDDHFQLNADKMLAAADQNTKLMWLCSPNNPTGNDLNAAEMERLLNTFDGIVVIDEAYSDFSRQKTFRERLSEFPNLIVLNTFSKAWGSAAIRLGMAFAQQAIIDLFNKVKYPYNVNLLTQKEALRILDHRFDVEEWVQRLLMERTRMMKAFSELPLCEEVFPSNANFFLARVNDAGSVYQYLVERGIIVRNRSKITLCGNCLRITIGSPSENAELIGALRQYQ